MIISYKIYTYRHVDQDDLFDGIHKNDEKLFKDAFLEAGWHGDGLIERVWVPPFLMESSDDYGDHIYHVKQSDNGTSFLAVPETWMKFYLSEDCEFIKKININFVTKD